MLNHEAFYDKVVKLDKEFIAALAETDQKLPFFTSDPMVTGIWAATYAGWVRGRTSSNEYRRLAEKWKRL